MKFLKRLSVIVLILVAAFLVVAAFLPKVTTVTREIEISKSPSAIYGIVADFHTWDSWSHWAKMDPTQKVTITGEAGKVGSVMSWNGNKTGSGTQTLTVSEGGKSLVYMMHFTKPMDGYSKTWLNFEASKNGTKVIWKLSSDNKYPIERWTGLMMGSMIGSAFDNSLGNLKKLAESQK